MLDKRAELSSGLPPERYLFILDNYVYIKCLIEEQEKKTRKKEYGVLISKTVRAQRVFVVHANSDEEAEDLAMTEAEVYDWRHEDPDDDGDYDLEGIEYECELPANEQEGGAE